MTEKGENTCTWPHTQALPLLYLHMCEYSTLIHMYIEEREREREREREPGKELWPVTTIPAESA